MSTPQTVRPSARPRDLNLAAGEGHAAVVMRLLEAGADVNATEKDGVTALHWAAKDGHTAIVMRLLAAGANVHARDEDGLTALDWAAKQGHAAIVMRLRKAEQKPKGF